jgi:hypothetical protein
MGATSVGGLTQIGQVAGLRRVMFGPAYFLICPNMC